MLTCNKTKNNERDLIFGVNRIFSNFFVMEWIRGEYNGWFFLNFEIGLASNGLFLSVLKVYQPSVININNIIAVVIT